MALLLATVFMTFWRVVLGPKGELRVDLRTSAMAPFWGWMATVGPALPGTV